jgi:RecJ-like exonuclease
LRTWVFAHGDSDGICSGAIALATSLKAQVFFTNPYGLVEDLKAAANDDDVIICDIALSETSIDETLQRFSKISEKGRLTYIDHHPLPEGVSIDEMPGRIVHNLESSTSELAYSLYQSQLDSLLSRIAIYGAIGDYQDDTPVIQRLLRRMDKRTLYFESGILVQSIEGQKRNCELKRNIIFKLANNTPPSAQTELVDLAVKATQQEESAIRELISHIRVDGNIAYVSNFPFSLGKTAIYASGLTDTLVGIACEDWKNVLDMSLRTSSHEIDLNGLLRRIVPKLGGSGGGHREAAGARIPKNKFKTFIEELNRNLTQDTKK